MRKSELVKELDDLRYVRKDRDFYKADRMRLSDSLSAVVRRAEAEAGSAARLKQELRDCEDALEAALALKPFPLTGLGNCPKCGEGSWDKYLVGHTCYMPEILRWSCESCGYHTTTRTLEDKRGT